jgi:hypothetical protein
MTRLVWDELESRRYEAGISHGVLYLPSSQGVVWNGLVSVVDGSVGGEQQALYQDGIKYYDVISGKNYQATISAYYYPKEFEACVGDKQAAPGIHLTRQSRTRFNFAYQSHYNEGYKIHLIYNALATPSDRNHETESNQPNPIILSWTLDAVPVAAPGFKPSAHYVIDSTKAELTLFNELEAVLYGTGISEPEFPTIEALLALFEVDIP